MTSSSESTSSDSSPTAPQPGSDNTRSAPNRVYPPLQVWKLALLIIVTFGLYVLVWIFRAARDLRNLGNRKLIPWLYIFSVYIPLVVPFSSSRIWGGFQQLLSEERRAHALLDFLVPLLAFIAALLAVLIERLNLNWGYYFLLFMIMPLPWCFIQWNVNRVKRFMELDESAYTSKPYKYNWWQIAIIVICLPLTALFYWGIGDETFRRATGTQFTAGSTYQSPQGYYAFTFPSGNWTEAPNYVSADTATEFLGPYSESWIGIYEYTDPALTLTDVVEFRKQEIQTQIGATTCIETRRLLPDSSLVNSTMECKGRSLGSFSQYAVSVFETESMLVEFLGNVVNNSSDAVARQYTDLHQLMNSIRLAP